MDMKKTIVTAALACSLLATAAGAAAAAPANAVPPAPGGEGSAAQAPAYEVKQYRNDTPLHFSGTAVELGEKGFTIQDESQEGTYNKVVVNVSDETVILDAVTGEVKGLADVEKDAQVVAYVSPLMTRSLPPIANGVLVLVNIPADFGVPTYSEVLNVTPREDGGVDLYVSGNMVLHLSDDTELTAYKTKNVVSLADLKPGTRVLAWYDVVMMSFPGQANPGKVMVFPYGYQGYVDTDAGKVLLNGQDTGITGRAVDGRLMVPVRAMAEALGCEVAWEAQTNAVAVKRGEDTLYTFTIGGDSATLDSDLFLGLTVPSVAQDGVTYMALDDLISLHELKLVDRAF